MGCLNPTACGAPTSQTLGDYSRPIRQPHLHLHRRQMIFHENATRDSSAALTNASRSTANSTPPILHGRRVTFGVPITNRRLVMIATVRFGTLVGLLVFCVACGAQPGPSTAPTPLAPAPTPPAPPSGPPLSGPSTTYHFSAPLDRSVRSYTPTSKYVLYNNGAFSLRYEAFGGGAYTASYRQEDGRILFDFAADRRRLGARRAGRSRNAQRRFVGGPI